MWGWTRRLWNWLGSTGAKRVDIEAFTDGWHGLSDRVLAERTSLVQNLAASEQRLRLTIDKALDAVVMIDERSVITGWNPQAERTFGWTEKEAVGRSLAELIIPEEYREAHTNGLKHFLATGEGPVFNERLELTALRRGGETFPVELTISPLQLPNGYQFSAFVRDITERKEQQRQLVRYAAELARSNKELDDFAYAASHDLRAPLRAVDSIAQWIQEDAKDQVSRQTLADLDLMRRRIARMDRLLEDLLAYSRVGRVEENIEEVDCVELVRGVVDMLAPPAEFTIVVDHLPVVATPRAPLEQVFRNLIGNAVKHHERPAGRIEVGCRTEGAWLEFTVADDGPGIPAEFQNDMFQMFKTLKPRDKVEASGMGLAFVKKIVQNQGGRIALESEPGKGATFRFTWPNRTHQTSKLE